MKKVCFGPYGFDPEKVAYWSYGIEAAGSNQVLAISFGQGSPLILPEPYATAAKSYLERSSYDGMNPPSDDDPIIYGPG